MWRQSPHYCRPTSRLGLPVQKVVGYALKYCFQCGEDLWDCIVRNVKRLALPLRLSLTSRLMNAPPPICSSGLHQQPHQHFCPLQTRHVTPDPGFEIIQASLYPQELACSFTKLSYIKLCRTAEPLSDGNCPYLLHTTGNCGKCETVESRILVHCLGYSARITQHRPRLLMAHPPRPSSTPRRA